MAFEFNSQIRKRERKVGTTKEYSIQITTDNYEQFLFIQEMSRECIDGKHSNKLPSCDSHISVPSVDNIHTGIFPDTDSTTVDLNAIPQCCRGCSNHPLNGGSGNCNCVAPFLNTTTGSSISGSSNIKVTNFIDG